jgi:hypothetical protein
MSATMGGVQLLEETLASIRKQYHIVTDACGMVAGSLRTGAIDEGLRALERMYITLLMAEELIDFIGRVGASDAMLDEAHRLKDRMLQRAAPWLAAAVRDLPGAETMVRTFELARRGAPQPSTRSRRSP